MSEKLTVNVNTKISFELDKELVSKELQQNNKTMEDYKHLLGSNLKKMIIDELEHETVANLTVEADVDFGTYHYKPVIYVIYWNEEALERLMSHFRLSEPVEIQRHGLDKTCVYAHYDVHCIKKKAVSHSLRGHKPTKLLVEREVYNNSELDALTSSLSINGILGSHTIEIFD